jgi:hypothetical protein
MCLLGGAKKRNKEKIYTEKKQKSHQPRLRVVACGWQN